jgi:hypothetical protein
MARAAAPDAGIAVDVHPGDGGSATGTPDRSLIDDRELLRDLDLLKDLELFETGGFQDAGAPPPKR